MQFLVFAQMLAKTYDGVATGMWLEHDKHLQLDVPKELGATKHYKLIDMSH